MKQFAAEKRFEDAMLQLARSQSIGNVFDDFLDFALRFSRWWDLEPSHFDDLEKRYTEVNDARLMAEAYLAMGDIADNNGMGFKDPFGDFYMEHLSNERMGQFFTPEPICQLTALSILGSNVPDDATILDPCCGSGRLLLSAAKINRKALFYAADIDLTCCRMTLLNYLMNTMRGEVSWMDTLSQKHWKSWQVGRVLDGNGKYVPYYQEITLDQSRIAAKISDQSKPNERLYSVKKAKASKRSKAENSPQLILF